ncbi:MAG: ferritin family protein [Dehalobacterium sp.]
MLQAFKGMDVLSFAVEIEKNGKNFYESVAKIIDDTGVKEAFLKLKEQEEQHVVDFEQLLDQITVYQPQETYSGEYLDYVKALVDNHVFNTNTDIKAIAEAVKNKADALDLALKFEKDSILFFAELKHVVAPRNHGVIENLIAQEREHIRVLAELRNLG